MVNSQKRALGSFQRFAERNAGVCMLLGLAALFCACGSRGADPAGSAAALTGQDAGPGIGGELEKPGGGTFFLDPHHSGTGTVLHLAEMAWGRLVDIHD